MRDEWTTRVVLEGVRSWKWEFSFQMCMQKRIDVVTSKECVWDMSLEY